MLFRSVLTGMGGVYRSSGTKNGLWKYPFDPSDILAVVVESKELNPLALFETPAAVADQLIEMHRDLCLWSTRLHAPYQRVPEGDPDDGCSDDADKAVMLEPSAGRGALIRALKRAGYQGKIVAVELDPTNLALLRKQFGADPQVIIVEGDILTVDLSAYGPFDGAVMNPPFNAPGGANSMLYIDHIRRALQLVRPRHYVASVTPNGWRFSTRAKALDFYEDVQESGDAEPMPKGSFKESGWMGEPWLITIRHELPQDAPGPWPCWSDDPFPTYRCGYLWNAIEGGDERWWKARKAIFHQMENGTLPLDWLGFPEPQTRVAIVKFYQDIADWFKKEEGTLIRLRPNEEQYMVDQFLDWYATWQRERDGQAIAA